MTSSTDVLVVGAGPAGGAAAVTAHLDRHERTTAADVTEVEVTPPTKLVGDERARVCCPVPARPPSLCWIDERSARSRAAGSST